MQQSVEIGHDVAGCSGSLSLLRGDSLTLFQAAASEATLVETRLRLQPDRPAIVGRALGGEVPYLDPSYTPSPIVPGTPQTILSFGGRGYDLAVSRGHFMVRAVASGLLLVNGVPSREGGIRPPLNGTWLILPEVRSLRPCEEYLIHRGSAAVFRLPNGSEVRIEAS